MSICRQFKKGYTEYYNLLFKTNLKYIPLYINDKDEVIRELAKWRINNNT